MRMLLKKINYLLTNAFLRKPSLVLYQSGKLWKVTEQTLSEIPLLDLEKQSIILVNNAVGIDLETKEIPKLTFYERWLFQRKSCSKTNDVLFVHIVKSKEKWGEITLKANQTSPFMTILEELNKRNITVFKLYHSYILDIDMVDQSKKTVPQLVVSASSVFGEQTVRLSFFRDGLIADVRIIADSTHADLKAYVSDYLRYLEHSQGVRPEHVKVMYNKDVICDTKTISDLAQRYQRDVYTIYQKDWADKKTNNFRAALYGIITNQKQILLFSCLFMLTIFTAKGYEWYASYQDLIRMQYQTVTTLKAQKSPYSLSHTIFLSSHQRSPFSMFSVLKELRESAHLINFRWQQMPQQETLQVSFLWRDQENARLIKKLMARASSNAVNYKCNHQNVCCIILKKARHKT